MPRLDSPGALHHVMGRGLARTPIVSTEADREDFLGRLVHLCGARALSVYTWALQPNAFHLLVRTGGRSLPQRMRRLCQIVVRGMGYSGAAGARFLGVTTSAVNQLAASEELPEIERYLNALQNLRPPTRSRVPEIRHPLLFPRLMYRSANPPS